MVKNLPAVQETWVPSLGRKDPLEEVMATHSSILAWIIHEQRSLASYSPQGPEDLDTTERLSTAKGLVSIGSVSSDVSSHRLKILEKIQKVTKKPNLNLPHAGNYLHNFDMVLGIISNLERIKSIQEDAHRLYANTTSFDIRTLNSCSFAIRGASKISLCEY